MRLKDIVFIENGIYGITSFFLKLNNEYCPPCSINKVLTNKAPQKFYIDHCRVEYNTKVQK